jgi:capsular exopolysaccharide synthesis family protein
MSRIEEALKRASASVPGSAWGAAAIEESPAVPSGESTLAHYPREARHREGEHRKGPASPASKAIAAPRVGRRGQLGPFSEALDGKLVLGPTDPVAIEQYRRLAASVHELQGAHGTKTLMMTSAVPQEGKSLTVTNLALTLSESYGRRVLLIDADLRRPSIHDIFRLPNAKGLSEGLRSDSGEISLLQVSPRLSILPAGRPTSNPMAGLTSDRMRVLLQESAAVFDWVLLDAPPVGIMPDAHLLAGLTDGVIFVIAAGSTPFALVERAVSEIGRDSIVGTVLNRIEAANTLAAGYYDHYYNTDGTDQS